MKNKAHTRYRLLDRKTQVPGVTTITGMLGWNKQVLVNWANRKGLEGINTSKYVDDKAAIGTLGHQMCTDFLLSQKTNTDDYSKNQIESAKNSANSFFRWIEGKKIEPILIETPLVSERFKYGGTPDVFAKVDGMNELIDLKTGAGIYDEMVIQVSAYQQLLEENEHKVENVRILNIPRTKGESFIERVVSLEISEVAWGIFVHCLHIYQLRKEMRR